MQLRHFHRSKVTLVTRSIHPLVANARPDIMIIHQTLWGKVTRPIHRTSLCAMLSGIMTRRMGPIALLQALLNHPIITRDRMTSRTIRILAKWVDAFKHDSAFSTFLLWLSVLQYELLRKVVLEWKSMRILFVPIQNLKANSKHIFFFNFMTLSPLQLVLHTRLLWYTK